MKKIPLTYASNFPIAKLGMSNLELYEMYVRIYPKISQLLLGGSSSGLLSVWHFRCSSALPWQVSRNIHLI